jgi:hypothetical protein
MKKLNLILVTLFILPYFAFSQETSDFTEVKTNSGVVKVQGKWELIETTNDSGQRFLKNKDGVIIAIAENPKKAYPFYKKNIADFESVKLFYKWDSDYYKENNFKVEKIKENAKSEYIIWKYNDKKMDNVFLFGSSEDNFLNLLVYTNTWSQEEKINFLENLYEINR